ncbi:MAG: amidohydrolase family protein [Pseudomonadales bacterium]
MTSNRWRLWIVCTALMSGCGDTTTQGEGGGADSPGLKPMPAETQGQRVRVSEGTNMALALDPAGERLVISVQGVLFVVPAVGGDARAITDQYQDAREPAWSPDGRSIVYHGYGNGNWDIWSVSADGGPPRALTSDAFDDREAQFTPAGDHLVFSSDRSGNYDIWSIDLTDNTLTQITTEPSNEHSPAVSANGERIAYAVGLSRAQYELHVADANGGDTRVVATERGSIAGVSWLPDGQSLSYQLLSLDSSGTPITQLRQLNLAESSAVPISDAGSDVFPFRAAWADQDTGYYTADGHIKRWQAGTIENIPFNAELVLNRQPYERKRRDHDDDGPRQALGLVGPALSPDGQQVAFTALGDLWLWDPASTSLERLTNDPFAEQMPAWSHDGGRIGYISDRRGKAEFWVYNLATSSHEAIEIPVAGDVSYPSWSPDGDSVALFASIPGNPLGGQLTVVDLISKETTRVNRPIPPQSISWSWDGHYVASAALAPYSSRYREGVYRLEVADLHSDGVTAILPAAHKSMLDAVLTPKTHSMSYVQGATLWQADLDEEFSIVGAPRQLTSELTDNPSWSAGGEYLVFMSADRMKRLHLPSGTVEDITPELSWSPAQPDKTWTLRVGRLFDGTTNGYRENVDIRIAGNRIAAIEPASEKVDPTLIDASNMTVIPGLFEMHAHMGADSGAQGKVWLAYGVTTVRDPGSNPYLAKARQEAWDSGHRIGPRTHVTGYLADGNRVYYSIAEGLISEAHLELALSRAKALKLDFIKTYVRLPDRWQARVVEFAHGIGIPVSSHELFPAVAHGMDHVEHIGGTSRRGYQPKVSLLGYSYDDVITLLSESGMGITATAVLPGFWVTTASSPDFFETPQFERFYGAAARRGYDAMASRFGMGAAATAKANGRTLRALTERNALLVTGTDAPFVPYGAGLHAELRLFADAGLEPYEVLRAATLQSARAAGVADDLGTLEVGKLADLVVVDGDPLRDIADADNVIMTVKNGRLYTLEQLLAVP